MTETDAETARREALEQASEHAQHHIFSMKTGEVIRSSCACGIQFPTQGSCEAWAEHIRTLPPKERYTVQSNVLTSCVYDRNVSDWFVTFSRESDAIAYAAWRNREARDGV